MQYKTITLSLIEQRPHWHQQLRQAGTMLATLDEYALKLKTMHVAWQAELIATRPASDPQQLSSAALELAMQELQEQLPPEPTEENEPTKENEGNETFNLDDAMAFLRRHTPPA